MDIPRDTATSAAGNSLLVILGFPISFVPLAKKNSRYKNISREINTVASYSNERFIQTSMAYFAPILSLVAPLYWWKEREILI